MTDLAWIPLVAGMSAGILVLLLNAAAGVMIVLNNYLSTGYMNGIMTVTYGCMLLMIALCVREEYGRPQDKLSAQ